MNSKMTANSQLLTTTPKTKTKTKTKPTTRTGTEPQKWRSHGGREICSLPPCNQQGGGNWENGTGNK